jgi:hypothetical protein
MSNEAAPAQVTYTTNAFASPVFLGPLVTLIASVASAAGVHVLDDPALQQQLILVLGIVLTWALHWQFPGASGKLGLDAPAPWTAPASQDISTGTSVVSVPAPTATVQTTAVQPLPVSAPRVVEPGASTTADGAAQAKITPVA